MIAAPPMEFREWFQMLTPGEQQAINDELKRYPLAAPQPGPQTTAYNSPADVVGFGGAAGGGKSGLAALLAIHAHEQVVIFRREKAQMKSLIDDIVKFYGSDDGLNRQEGRFKLKDRPNHVIEWGGLSQPDEEKTWRGRPHDLIVFDEATEIPFQKVHFVMGWLRSVTVGQRCRVLMTFNPPGSSDEGRWVIDYFAPWLDERHPDPADPGEIRWFYRNSDNQEVEKKDGKTEKVVLANGSVVETEPQSRTFIPSLVDDNMYLKDTGYKHHLMTLEEPFRSQMLLGDFRSGITDSENQLIKASWVDDAMDRWEKMKLQGRGEPMDAMGVDVSRGGNNFTVIARRHAFFWDELIRIGGKDADDGPKVATACIEAARDGADICIDVLGVGASPTDFLRQARVNVHPVNSVARKGIPQPEHTVRMYNMRASCWWMLRKVLDPANGCEPALPRDRRLRSDLLAIRYSRDSEHVKIDDKRTIMDRLGHSPDDGDAVAYSLARAMYDPHTGDMISPRTAPPDFGWAEFRQQRKPTPYAWMTR